LLTAAIAVIARMWTSRQRRVFELWPDEPAQLGIARFIGSGVRWNMYNHSTWRPGFGTLLAPVYWFTDAPTTVFRAALVLNALLGGIAAVLLYALTRRLTALGPRTAAAIATLVSLAPASLFTTNYAWSEALVQALYPATLLVLMRFHDRPTVARGAAAGTLAVAAFVTHSRMLPLALVVVALTAVTLWQRRITPGRAGVVVGWTSTAFFAASWYSEWIVDRLWNEPFERNSYGGVLEQVRKFGSMFTATVGQTWYLLVTTAGVAAVGAVSLVAQAWRRRDGRSAPRRADARIVFACTAMLVALSIVFMADRWRADQIVYGRYNDAAIMPVLVLGLSTIVRARSRVRMQLHLGAVIVLTVAAGGVLDALRREELAANDGPWTMILGLQPFIGTARSIDVTRITAVALVMVFVIAFWTALCRPATVRGVTLVPFLVIVAVGYTRADRAVDRALNSRAGVQAVEGLGGTVIPDGTEVAYFIRPGSDDTGRMMEYQFYLPDVTFEVVNSIDPDRLETPFLFAPADDATLAAARATVRWRDSSAPIALWELRR
jgi:hypothetical protein